jgi:mercuric ion transport protein
MKSIAGYVLAGTALIACPCHLVLILPLVLGLLGGTTLGAALGAHTGWVIAAATVYFVVALAGGIYLLNRRGKNGERKSVTSSAAREAGVSVSDDRAASGRRHATARQR